MANTIMTDIPAPPPPAGAPAPPLSSTINPQPPKPKKKKRKRKGNRDPAMARAQAPHHRALLTPQWSYILLSLLSGNTATSAAPLDAVTVRTHLTTALTQFLGDTGAAVSVDIMKIEEPEGSGDGGRGRAWIRVPVDDLRKVVAAVGGWVGNPGTDDEVGWRVIRAGRWLSGLIGQECEGRVWKA